MPAVFAFFAFLIFGPLLAAYVPLIVYDWQATPPIHVRWILGAMTITAVLAVILVINGVRRLIQLIGRSWGASA